MNTRLLPGASIPQGTVWKPDGEAFSLPSLARGRKVALYFLRDYACVLTQHLVQQLSQEYEKYRSKGWELLVIVDGTPSVTGENLGETHPPFPLLCGGGDLYAAFGVGCAASMETLGNDDTALRIQAARAAGFLHGVDSGNQLRLPALFLLSQEGRISFCHYATYAGDAQVLDTSRLG